MKSAADVWEKVKTLMEKDMTAVSIETWFGDVEAVALDESGLILCVPTEFKRNIIRTRFLKSVEDRLRELFSFDVAVTLLLPEERDQYRKTGPAQPGDPAFQEYTFDRFVVGSTNKFAFTAAEKVADEPGGAYNPLFIYGQSGLGKTHLLHAIANRVRENHPSYRIMYIKSEDFVNELISNLRHGNDMQGFRDKYRTVDLFLMDDVQFIAGKDSSEEELFHTFNTLYEQKKQIVFTSDRPPQEMLRLEQRLKTRFEQGLPADIQPPDYETRMAIIKNKAIRMGVELPEEVLSYIAENVTANVRQIEGTVKKILAFRDLLGNNVDANSVTRAVRDMFKETSDILPTAEVIIEEVGKFYDIDPAAIRGQGRTKATSWARHIAIYLTRHMTKLSLKDIGKEFDNRDHTTILHSIDRVEKQCKSDPETNEIIKDIRSNINERYN